MLHQSRAKDFSSTIRLVDSSRNEDREIRIWMNHPLRYAGQTFYQFTLENLRHFGALKAMGAGNWALLKMILLQALLVGSIGYCAG